MRVVHVVTSSRRLRWLAISALAAAGALAWRAAHRTSAPPPPLIECAIPDVTLPQPQPHFAIPPPGDPYPRRPDDLVEAVLIDSGTGLPDCGDRMFDRAMIFHVLKSIDGSGADLRVLVPCADMTGLKLRHRYMLWLTPSIVVADGKNDTLWLAERIEAR